MNVKKANAILAKQRNKVNNPPSNNDQELLFQTASYIKSFFGEDSVEYSFISRFNFTVVDNGRRSHQELNQILEQKPVTIINFLNNCIETLSDKGLYKKENFLHRMSSDTL